MAYRIKILFRIIYSNSLPHILLRCDTILFLTHHVWITAILNVDQNSFEFSTVGDFHWI